MPRAAGEWGGAGGAPAGRRAAGRLAGTRRSLAGCCRPWPRCRCVPRIRSWPAATLGETLADKMSGLRKWNLEGSVQASKVRVRAGARAFSERGRGETARAAKGSEAKAVQWSEGSRRSPEESQQTSTAKQESGRPTEVNRQVQPRPQRLGAIVRVRSPPTARGAAFPVHCARPLRPSCRHAPGNSQPGSGPSQACHTQRRGCLLQVQPRLQRLGAARVLNRKQGNNLTNSTCPSARITGNIATSSPWPGSLEISQRASAVGPPQ